MATPVNTTTGVVYLVGWPGTISGGSLTLSGTLQLADGSAAAPSLTFTSDTDTGRYRSTTLFGLSNTIVDVINGTNSYVFSLGGLIIPSTSTIAWANGAISDVASTDVILARGAPNTLDLRNGTNAQTFWLYNSYTSGSAYQRGGLNWSSNFLRIGTVSATDSNRGVRFFTGDTDRWELTTSGHLLSLGNFNIKQEFTSLGVTSTDGIVLSNTTAASAGAQQMPPRVRFDGFGWKTDATAASQAVSFINELLPVQGAAAPTANLLWKYAVNGGAYSTVLSLASNGDLLPGSTNAQDLGSASVIWNQIFASQAVLSGNIKFTSSSVIENISDGIVQFKNNAETGFTRLILGANSTSGVALKLSGGDLHVREGDDSAYEGIDAGAYSVGGVAGASFGPGVVTSITVVNGIVTAIS